MKKTMISCAILIVALSIATIGIAKSAGERCVGDAECDFGAHCNNGVCVKKPEFDRGGSGKSGKPCSIDADCIGSGKCVEGSFGKKYCSGS